MAPLDRLRATAPAEARPDEAGARAPEANTLRPLEAAGAAAGPRVDGLAGWSWPGSLGRSTGLLPALPAESPERMTSAAVDSPCAAQRPCTTGACAAPEATDGRELPWLDSDGRCSLGGKTGGATPPRSASRPPGSRLPSLAGSVPTRPPPGALAMLFLLGLSPTACAAKALLPEAVVAAAAANVRPARTAATPLEAPSLPALVSPTGEPALRLLRRGGAVDGIVTSELPCPVDAGEGSIPPSSAWASVGAATRAVALFPGPCWGMSMPPEALVRGSRTASTMLSGTPADSPRLHRRSSSRERPEALTEPRAWTCGSGSAAPPMCSGGRRGVPAHAGRGGDLLLPPFAALPSLTTTGRASPSLACPPAMLSSSSSSESRLADPQVDRPGEVLPWPCTAGPFLPSVRGRSLLASGAAEPLGLASSAASQSDALVAVAGSRTTAPNSSCLAAGSSASRRRDFRARRRRLRPPDLPLALALSPDSCDCRVDANNCADSSWRGESPAVLGRGGGDGLGGSMPVAPRRRRIMCSMAAAMDDADARVSARGAKSRAASGPRTGVPVRPRPAAEADIPSLAPCPAGPASCSSSLPSPSQSSGSTPNSMVGVGPGGVIPSSPERSAAPASRRLPRPAVRPRRPARRPRGAGLPTRGSRKPGLRARIGSKRARERACFASIGARNAALVLPPPSHRLPAPTIEAFLAGRVDTQPQTGLTYLSWSRSGSLPTPLYVGRRLEKQHTSAGAPTTANARAGKGRRAILLGPPNCQSRSD